MGLFQINYARILVRNRGKDGAALLVGQRIQDPEILNRWMQFLRVNILFLFLRKSRFGQLNSLKPGQAKL